MALYLGSEKLGVTIGGGGNNSGNNLIVGDGYKIICTDVAYFEDDGSVDLSEILSNGDIYYVIGIYRGFEYITFYDPENEVAGFINSSGAIEFGSSYYSGDNYWYFDPEMSVVTAGGPLYLIGLGYE